MAEDSHLRGSNDAEDPCADYYEYMNMTAPERHVHLSEIHCIRSGRGEGLWNIVDAVEALADTDTDKSLTCEEFNNAYMDLSTVHLCDE